MQAECYRVHILVIKHLLGVRKTQLRTGSLSPTYETDLSWVFEWARRKWLLLTCCNLSSAMIKSYGHICCWCGHGHAMLHWSLLFTRWPILLGRNLATWPVAQLLPQVEKQEGNALYRPMAYCADCPDIWHAKILHIAILWSFSKI